MMGRSSIEQHPIWNKLKRHRYIRFALFVLLGLILYVMLVPNVLTEDLDLEPGSVSGQDVRSPVTIENKEETERLQQEAADSVEPVYSLKPRYADNQMERVQDVFQSVRLVQLEVRGQAGELSSPGDEEGGTEEQEVWTMNEQTVELRDRLSPEIEEQMSDGSLVTLLESDAEELQTAEEATTSAVFDVMTDEVALDEVNEARDRAEQRVRAAALRAELSDALAELSRSGITANYMIDEDATAEARNSAEDLVEPVLIREGQLLAEEGQVITAEIYEQMALAGLTEETSDLPPLAGLGLVIFFLVWMLAIYLREARTPLRENNTLLLLFLLLTMVTLAVMKSVSLLQPLEITGLPYLVPAALGTILTAVLIQARVAVFMSFFLAVAASIMFNQNTTQTFEFGVGLFVFFSSLSGVFFLDKTARTKKLLKTGSWIALVNTGVVISILLIKNQPFVWSEYALYAAAAALGGYVAVVLAAGLLPFFETGFGVLTPAKLIELSNPNNALLRKILLETPGTYHHSVVVANLAESACESIGADGLLARVGAYYHDLGKTKRPQFFIENQMRIANPHDKLPPEKSAEIIIAHPYDGAAMLREERLPKEIIDIAEQHHGTTLLKYFYVKAKEKDGSVTESSYRYPGPKAASKESAIVGIADSVEAAVRSMQAPTYEKMEGLVRAIIKDRLNDGQFDDCDLTLKELHAVHASICETLKGTFHSRIDYPDEKELKKTGGD
ncbi:HD family phosphohydrolase [Bacillus daqingensis]|uniref:HD family phosphohydrolase n=1 Tax=Bacillus daqingensis TaxID=872396 RepID=A0ABV9P0M6_9BACI